MPFEIPPDLHPDLMPLAWLLGSWHGNGRGEYPTVDAFTYEQDVVFAHDARPFLHYFSRAWITDDEGARVRPGALETGFLRPVGDGQVELVLAHATGYAEVWYGNIDGPRLTLATDIVARTSTARDYTAGHRMYGLVEGDLMYAYDMAAEGHEMQSHLWGRLERV
ncbi:FABP family protein [Aeromicrobium sp.]|uniref:FABP family protein n=1 Tax=Aeromicrobium sp. TaxID=1871063 RepID=UPI0019897569|nr:FABP family protein [Aeromicrobium sp.]MBC7631295.1 FABP family protein [Aeromicrobium sp.]